MASPSSPQVGRSRLMLPLNLGVLLAGMIALLVLLEINLFIPLRVDLVTNLLLKSRPVIAPSNAALDYITQQTRQFGDIFRAKARANYLNLENAPNFLNDIVWLFPSMRPKPANSMAEDKIDLSQGDTQSGKLIDEDGDGDLDPFIEDYDEAIEQWIKTDEPLPEPSTSFQVEPTPVHEPLFAPITVTEAELVKAVTHNTAIPPIALAAGVEIQAPGRWDDLMTVTLKCSIGDCNPSVGIGQIRPSEVEQFTQLEVDRFFVNLALINSPELSIRMMHAKLSEARSRFDLVCQGRCTETDYFLMYACAHNGMSTREMELAVNHSWNLALSLNDLAFATGDWSRAAKFRLYGHTGDRRWFIRRYVALLEDLQAQGYHLPAGVDLDYMRSLAQPRIGH